MRMFKLYLLMISILTNPFDGAKESLVWQILILQ